MYGRFVGRALKSRAKSAREKEPCGVGQGPGEGGTGAGSTCLLQGGWLEGRVPREASAAYEDTAHGATLCCAASEPGVQRALLRSGSVFYMSA